MLTVLANPSGGRFIEFLRVSIEAKDDAATILFVDLSITGTTATVNTTAGFPPTGALVIEDENISYTGKTSTTFTGLTRGINGTFAAAHSFNNAVLLLGPFEILYTLDGSIPSSANAQTVNRLSPIRGLPIDRAKTLKYFARKVGLATGTVTTTGITVTGVGTLFTTQLAVGDKIIINGQERTIATISIPTALTVTATFAPNIVIGVGFKFVNIFTITKIEFYDLTELTARNAIPTVPANIRNYTLKITDSDLARSSQGLYDVVYGLDKAKQDIREIILVEDIPDGAPFKNRTLPQFGSALNRILGQSFPASFAASAIESSIFDALNTLTELQRSESVPSSEQINRIISVTVIPKTETDFKYTFVVETLSGARFNNGGIVIVSGS